MAITEEPEDQAPEPKDLSERIDIYAETTISNIKYTISLGNSTVVTRDGVVVEPKVNGGMKEVLRFIAKHLEINLPVTHTRRIAKVVIRELDAKKRSYPTAFRQ